MVVKHLLKVVKRKRSAIRRRREIKLLPMILEMLLKMTMVVRQLQPLKKRKRARRPKRILRLGRATVRKRRRKARQLPLVERKSERRTRRKVVVAGASLGRESKITRCSACWGLGALVSGNRPLTIRSQSLSSSLATIIRLDRSWSTRLTSIIIE